MDIKVEVWAGDTCDLCESGLLVDFVAWTNSMLESVPDEFRSQARIVFDRGYSGERDDVEIYYSRPETPEEEAARLTAAAERNRAQLAAARRQEIASLVAIASKYSVCLSVPGEHPLAAHPGFRTHEVRAAAVAEAGQSC